MKHYLIGGTAHFQLLPFTPFLPTRLALGLPTKALSFSKWVLGRRNAAVATIFWVFVFFQFRFQFPDAQFELLVLLLIQFILFPEQLDLIQ